MIATHRFHQTWLAGKYTIYFGDEFQLGTLLSSGFPSPPRLMKPKANYKHISARWCPPSNKLIYNPINYRYIYHNS